MKKVKFFKERIKATRGINGIPFVATYHPQLKHLGKVINKTFYLLDITEETKRVFLPRPMISFRNPRKISNYLVRAKLHPLGRVVGSTNYGNRRREVCRMSLKRTHLPAVLLGRHQNKS